MPLSKMGEWSIARDSVQAISCLVEALYIFSREGKHLLYETSVQSILLVLEHLSNNSTYLAIITGSEP